VEGFVNLNLKIFLFTDDRKAIIVYAIYCQKGSNKMPNKHPFCLCSLLILFFVSTGCIKADSASETLEITVPPKESGNDRPIIDGILQPGEWDQADPHYFEDGSELHLLYSENHLYLAIKTISPENRFNLEVMQ